MKFNEIIYIPEFQRDLKKLKKRYRTLEEDIENLINAGIAPFHKLGIDIGGIERMPGLGIQHPRVYKARKFACRSLKGTGSRSGIRVIYAYFENEDKVVFVEIYYKGDKKNEDRQRILKLFQA